MRKIILAASALAVAMPVSMTFPVASAEAQTYRGKNYRWVCKKRGGTTGAIVGGGAGALIGSALGGTTATIVGAAGGALAGREVERTKKRNDCRRVYYRR